eukprot:363299-Chlamydomonas_euryale.AAC.5
MSTEAVLPGVPPGLCGSRLRDLGFRLPPLMGHTVVCPASLGGRIGGGLDRVELSPAVHRRIGPCSVPYILTQCMQMLLLAVHLTAAAAACVVLTARDMQ